MTIAKNRVYEGDCIDLLGKVDEGTVDLVFADPPFNIGYEYDVYDDAKQTDDYLSWCQQWIRGVHRALKPAGTFWLAIGDEYAAELKIEAQRAGFHCRSWVIWYYTFGVNCVNGFSRSHTHLFHFVKDKKNFTFVRPNPNVRVKSARQLVYADIRANPGGRLPDNTWITRPQDAPKAFSPNHDTWYFSRVAGTFKEREGFHGCQMPEQLLARIIRTSSNPYDLVLDPFGGSGTTLCVAKKLRRNWIGFELSKDYAKHIAKRLDQTDLGGPIDGPDDPIESAPNTTHGKKRRKKDFDHDTIKAVIESYRSAGEGYPADYILCVKELDKKFIDECLRRGIGGNATVWNRLMLKLRKAGKLPRASRQPSRISAADLNRYGYASEVAWRLISDDFSSGSITPPSLDDILCCPDSADYFDRIAAEYGPQHFEVTSTQYRRAALSIRKMAKGARKLASKNRWPRKPLSRIRREELGSSNCDAAGVFLIKSQNVGVYAGEADNLREHLSMLFENPVWKTKFDPDIILFETNEQDFSEKYAQKSALVRKNNPLLNSKVWLPESSKK